MSFYSPETVISLRRKASILKILELYIRMFPLGDFSVKTIVLDVFDDLGQAFGEFLKILLVQEDLVFVI